MHFWWKCKKSTRTSVVMLPIGLIYPSSHLIQTITTVLWITYRGWHNSQDLSQICSVQYLAFFFFSYLCLIWDFSYCSFTAKWINITCKLTGFIIYVRRKEQSPLEICSQSAVIAGITTAVVTGFKFHAVNSSWLPVWFSVTNSDTLSSSVPSCVKYRTFFGPRHCKFRDHMILLFLRNPCMAASFSTAQVFFLLLLLFRNVALKVGLKVILTNKTQLPFSSNMQK